MIFGSEIRRKKDLEDLHEQALKAAELNLFIAKSTEKETNTQVSKTSKKSSKENSFADTIRTIPRDTDTITPLLTPDLYEEPAGSNEANNNNPETNDILDSDSSERTNRGKYLSFKSYNNNDNDIEKPPPTKTLSTRNNPNTTDKKSKAQGLPKSENAVASLLPQPQPSPVFDVKGEIESIRRHVLNQTPRPSLNIIEPKPVQESAPSSKQQQPPSRRSSNIIFDPVPGLFPKMFVDRFFKKRRVRVIMYGQNNSKKEYVIEGDKGDKLAKNLIDTSQLTGSKNTPVATVA